MLKDEKIWLCWKFITPQGSDKKTKVPFQPNGQTASSTDPSTWSTHRECVGVAGMDGVGIVLGEHSKIVGVDLDHIIVDGSIKNQYAQEFIATCSSYIERSPSKTGLHALYMISDFENLSLKVNKTPIKLRDTYGETEIYKGGRFFTFTEDVYGENDTLKKMTAQEFLDEISVLGYPWGVEDKPAKNTQARTAETSGALFDTNIMFNAKNGAEMRALWNGDVTKYNNDHSAADLALCATLAFYTRKDAPQIEQLWLSSPLGQREKTQTRKDYRDRTITEAIHGCTNVYTPKINFLKSPDKDGNLTRVRKIGPNIKKIFDEHPDFKGKFRYDSFNGQFETSFNKDEWFPLEDHILRVVISKIQEEFPYFDAGAETMIKDYAILSAMDNPISPPLQYVQSLKWDGVKRLDSWLANAYSVPSNEYYAEIGTRWLKYLARRLAYPGCQFDHVLVFRGGQGFGKSSALRALCNFDGKDYFNESDSSPDQGKDFAISLRGNIVYEFAEGAITGFVNQKKVKSFITKTVDKYRPPYMRNNANFPRQNVFAMSTNDYDFLSDKTGERRYWIIEIPEKEGLYANIKWVQENKDQLFAEAYTLIDEPYLHLPPKVQEYLDVLITDHKEVDPIEDFVVDWYDKLSIENKQSGVTLAEVRALIKGEQNMRELWSKYLDRDISRVFREVLRLELRSKREGNSVKRVYIPSEHTKLTEPNALADEIDF